MNEEERKKLAKELEGIVGEKYVAADDFHRWAYAIGEWISVSYAPVVDKYGAPDVVVKPQTTEEVSEIMRLANETKTPVLVRGGAEGNAAGPTPLKEVGGIVLDMTDMQKIIGYDEISGSVEFEAGLKWRKLHDWLRKKGLYTGFMGPHGLLGATIGGSISLNTVALNGAKFGQENENVLTLKVVLPTGEIVETGSLSDTAAKWHHRYTNGPDLAGIFLGSCGVFGVITEAAMRVWPIPDYMEAMAYIFPKDEDIVRTQYEANSYRLITDYMGVAPYGMAEGILPALTGGKERGIGLMLVDDYDKTIFEKKKELIDGIAKKHGGKELAIGGLMKAMGMPAMALDEYEFGGGAISKLVGGVPEKTCSLLPLLLIPEMNKACAKFFSEHNEALLYHQLLEKKEWAVVWIAGSSHGVATHITLVV